MIPGNDDAIRAVKLIAATVADAVIEANQGADAVRHNVEETTETVSMETVANEAAKEEATEEDAKEETATEVAAE